MDRNSQFYQIRIHGGAVGKIVIEANGAGLMVMDAYPGEIFHVEPKCMGERWQGKNQLTEGNAT